MNGALTENQTPTFIGSDKTMGRGEERRGGEGRVITSEAQSDH